MRTLTRTGLFTVFLGVMILSACSTATPTPAPTEEGPPPLTQDKFGGGLLYDNWMAAIPADTPAGDQPLWKTQTTNTRSGADTWRCKECHGWDYKGVDGAYGSGSHMTGFKGVLAASSMSEEELLAWLDGTKNADHDFSPYLKQEHLLMLVDFLKEGLFDTAAYINDDKTLNGGNAEHGKELFGNVCILCHGENGKDLNFGDESEPEYVGTIATDNPWELWHKVSYGQPGTRMPSGLRSGWSPQDILDVLAFAKTLPTK